MRPAQRELTKLLEVLRRSSCSIQNGVGIIASAPCSVDALHTTPAAAWRCVVIQERPDVADQRYYRAGYGKPNDNHDRRLGGFGGTSDTG